jgi:uracil phosphoribosyltransferase
MKGQIVDNLTIVRHPLVDHSMSFLRSRETDTETFQRHAQVVTRVLALEVLRDLETTPFMVATPLEETETRRVAGRVIFVPVLRSGMALLETMNNFVPGSKVGFVGMERDEDTAVAHTYYSKLPKQLGENLVVILDPMLATGGSAHGTLGLLHRAGARNIRLACIVAAPEGVDLLVRADPSIHIFTCALDRGLNERKYIVPGLGDFGDRYFGTAEE